MPEADVYFLNGTNSLTGAAIFSPVSASTPLPVTGSTTLSPGGTISTISAPTSVAADGITVVSSPSLEASLVLKASAGNLYYAEVTNGGTTGGFAVVMNEATASGTGSIAPSLFAPLPPNGRVVFGPFNPIPANFNAGITVLVTSATTPFTYTTGTITAAIAGLVE
jgi:hypothetical protein